ncbi:MAG: helix-hairpin-helix domain-containing protein, partial [Bacteroidetes bacterium]|nr:helix-hairpin-helix domain-containing protein [Bacteroidota bacterium]
VFILPYFYPSPKISTDKKEFEKFKNEIAQLKTQQRTDSFSHSDKREYKQEENDNEETSVPHETSVKTTLFYFDPNTASSDQWKKLGLRDKTIRTINNYLSKGGKFRMATDLKKIYGLREEEYQRISPYVQIENVVEKENKDEPRFTTSSHKDFSRISDIDINTTDTSALIALPGIGNKLASRIINFREKLGGFYSVDQVAETYGLPDSTFQKIKPHLKVNDVTVRKININTTDANVLKQHPYIKWNIANAIVQYRLQHGTFKSIEEIQQIAIITQELFRKIAPYLSIN